MGTGSVLLVFLVVGLGGLGRFGNFLFLVLSKFESRIAHFLPPQREMNN